MIRVKPTIFEHRLWRTPLFGTFTELEEHVYEVKIRLTPEIMEAAVLRKKSLKFLCDHIQLIVSMQLSKRGNTKMLGGWERRPMVFEGGVEQLVFKVRFK